MKANQAVMRLPRRALAASCSAAMVMIGAVFAWKAGVFDLWAPARAPLKVIVVGHNWWWEFIYPELGIKTANELHVPVGIPIQIELTSVDVLHTLSIPELSVTANALPSAVQQLQLIIDDSGEFGGECTEICGIAHNMMRARLVAETQAEFGAWVANQQKPAARPQSVRQTAGYDMLTTACAACHSLNPAEPRTDLLGPNLAHLMSRSVFAGASFALNETNLRRWIRDTQEMKAGNDMLVRLPRDDYESVIEYLLMLE